MTTSGGGLVNALLYAALLGLSLPLAFVIRPRAQRDADAVLTRTEAAGALAIWLVVAVPSLVQLAVPSLLPAMWRDPARIVGQAEAWRMLTSGVVQDGGVAGTAFNLVVLAIVAPLGVRVWGVGRAVAILVIVQLVFAIAATALVPVPGAGNSAATFGLAASIPGLAVVGSREPPVLARAGGAALVAIACLVIGDGHGIAMGTGFLLGMAMGVVSRG
jgi:hypothetical protein